MEEKDMVDFAAEDGGTEQTKNNNNKKKKKRVRRLRSIKIAKIYGGSDYISLLSVDLPDESERTCDSPNHMNNTTPSSSYREKKSARGMASSKSRKPLIRKWWRAAGPASPSPGSLTADAEMSPSLRSCRNSGSNSSRGGEKLVGDIITTRNPSLKPCRITMKKTPCLKLKQASATACSPGTESAINRPTCSSVLKHSKFAHLLQRQGEGTETKVCRYSYCSLHGMHAHKNKKISEGPRRVASIRDLSAKEADDNGVSEGACVGRGEGCTCNRTSVEIQDEETPVHQEARERPTDDIIISDDAAKKVPEQLNTPEEVKTNDPELLVNGSIEEEECRGEKDVGKGGLWQLIYQHMASTSISAEDESPSPSGTADEEDKEDLGSARRDAVESVKEAFDNIISQVTDPSSSDDQSVSSDIIPDDRVEEDNPGSSEKDDVDGRAKQAPKNWSKLKKMIIFSRFVKAVDNARKINYNYYHSGKEELLPSSENVSLRHRSMEDRKNPEEWMLDYALGKVIASLGAAQKRKVAMLARAFETIIPETRSPAHRHESRLDPGESEAVKGTICESACVKPVLEIEDDGNIAGGESNPHSDQIEAVRLVEQVMEEMEDDKAEEELLITRDESGEKVKKSWRNITKVVILQRFIAALQKQNEVNLPRQEEEQAEDVGPKHGQQMEERRDSDEWMVDHALQQVVAKLTPARKKKVALLVEAFESVVPPGAGPPVSHPRLPSPINL